MKIMSNTFFYKLNNVYSSYVEQFHCNEQPFYAPCLNKKRKKK